MVIIYIVGAMMAVTSLWIMLKFSKRTTPLSGLAGLCILGLGLVTGAFPMIAFGGGLLAFSLVIRAIGGAMNGDF